MTAPAYANYERAVALIGIAFDQKTKENYDSAIEKHILHQKVGMMCAALDSETNKTKLKEAIRIPMKSLRQEFGKSVGEKLPPALMKKIDETWVFHGYPCAVHYELKQTKMTQIGLVNLGCTEVNSQHLYNSYQTVMCLVTLSSLDLWGVWGALFGNIRSATMHTAGDNAAKLDCGLEVLENALESESRL
eukprot:2014786-Amphidinium_carterae.1